MKEQEEAVISNDDTSNINSNNESENNRIGDGDGDDNLNQISEEIWGTWEELVLTCAVQRHALDWDLIAKEVQIRVRSSLIATSINCEVKYQDLKRRFQDSVDAGEENKEAEDRVGEITWLEELRSIYVSELRRDIERYDESILSLQLKVKRLEEERDGDDGEKKPDLENNEIKTARIRRETTTEDIRSMNESGTSGGGNGDLKLTGDKSQPLIDIIKLIRSHPHGSVFESKLRSQETKHYKSLIRQHMDVKTIEKKIKKGSYVSSNLSFYRDLKLIYTNAIVFFPKSSSESMAAQELRTLVSKEMKKRSQSVIKTEDESSVSRQKEKPSVLPLVVCKKKSKSSPSSSVKQKDEKVSEEKTVTTVRSTRRASKETEQGKATKNTKTESSNDDDDKEEESSKTEKKKTVTAKKKKKKSVEDFLKRIEKNSPEKVKETKSKNQKKINGSVEKKESNNVKPRELRSNSKSTSKQKQTKETVSKATGKRSRESGKDDKQPKKRSRR